MKKLMIVALMAIVATTAFAGDSPTLKQILKADTYEKAESLIKSGLNQLANSAEKAKAYNKLVELSMKVLDTEDQKKAKNELAGKVVEQIDSMAYYNALVNAFKAAEECDKYDLEPNAKGKVAPKFHAKNVDKLLLRRGDLYNGGVYFYNKNDISSAFKFMAMYVDSHDSKLLSEAVAKTPDPDYANAAYNAASFAYRNEDFNNAIKYSKVAMKDEQLGNEANNMRIQATLHTFNTKQDSINYIKQLEAESKESPNDEITFRNLVDLYIKLNMADELTKALDDRLQIDPNNYLAWAVKGQIAQEMHKYEDAINCFSNALKSQETPILLYYLAESYMDRANEAEDRAAKSSKSSIIPQTAKDQIRPYYENAKKCLERCKELDPNQEQIRWAYKLETCEENLKNY